MLDHCIASKWPDVPACYDWLSLDRRGNWRLQGERITHSGLISFINREYGCDETGRWFLKNGPQQVFVSLAYTPWVLHFSGKDLSTHTGQSVKKISACFLDEEGSALIISEIGPGLLDDRDLPAFLEECRQLGNVAVDAEDWQDFMVDEGSRKITWRGYLLNNICQKDVPQYFNFQQNPLHSNPATM